MKCHIVEERRIIVAPHDCVEIHEEKHEKKKRPRKHHAEENIIRRPDDECIQCKARDANIIYISHVEEEAELARLHNEEMEARFAARAEATSATDIITHSHQSHSHSEHHSSDHHEERGVHLYQERRTSHVHDAVHHEDRHHDNPRLTSHHLGGVRTSVHREIKEDESFDARSQTSMGT